MAVLPFDQRNRIATLEATIKTLRRAADIYSQIADLKDEKIAKAYADCSDRIRKNNDMARRALASAQGWNKRFHEAIEQRDEALRHVPRGDNPGGFTFTDDTTLPCGQECDYTEDMVLFWASSYCILMDALIGVERSITKPEATDHVNQALAEVRGLFDLCGLEGQVDLRTGERYATGGHVEGDEP